MLTDLRARGVKLERRGDRLRIVGKIDEADIRALAEAKPIILVRLRLLELAAAEGIAPKLVDAIADADLRDCIGLPDDLLRAYLFAMRDSDMRQRGQVPPGENAVAVCARCGPAWLHPAVAAVLPVVDGLPRAAGCAWCRVARERVPHPEVES